MRGRRARWVQAVLLAFGVVGLVVLAVLWVRVPNFYRHAKDPGAAAAQTRTGILAAAAGFIAFTGVMLNIGETRQANDLARQRDEQARERDRLTHERELVGQLTERYTRAVDQLGSTAVDIRLGGIYALERLAKDSPADQPTIVEVLSAFVREHSTDPALRPTPPAGSQTAGQDDTASDAGDDPPRPATDIRAAVLVLARLPLLDQVARADLTGADLTGPARLAHLRFPPIANLTGADLAGADLTGAGLGGADLTGAGLAGANLTRAWLAGANLTRAWLAGANLTRAGLAGANLTRAWLVGANLTRAGLGGANLTRAQLVGANLTDAGLGGANLTRAWLAGANLTGADLDGANLTGAELDGANLTGADLDGANLTGAGLLTSAQVAAARGDADTRLPVGVARPASWPPEEGD